MDWLHVLAGTSLLCASCTENAQLRASVGRAPATPVFVVSEAKAPQENAVQAAAPLRLPCASDDLQACAAGCEEKVVEDCVTLAAMYMEGSGTHADPDRAITLLGAACDSGSARGCLRLGEAYRKGLRKGEREEVDYYRRACDGGANLGCVAEARAYLSGYGVTQDPGFAASLFGRACDRGSALACFELARLYDAGEGVKQNKVRAFEMFRKACKLGLDEGCLVASKTEETLSPRN